MACSEQPANDASKRFLFDEEKEIQEFDSKQFAQELNRETCDVCVYFGHFGIEKRPKIKSAIHSKWLLISSSSSNSSAI